jgi:hypothetical protein
MFFDDLNTHTCEVIPQGPARSGYDRTIRAMASQYAGPTSATTLGTIASNLVADIASIPRKNIAIASNMYEVRHVDEFTPTERLEVYNLSTITRDRLTIIIKLKPLPAKK